MKPKYSLITRKTENNEIEKNQMQFQLTELQKEIAQLQQLSTLIFPNQPYNFNQLQQEITRLKHQELAPQAREERVKFEQLINVAKSKAGNSEKIVELLLETQRQVVQTSEVSLRDKLKGKIEAYQNILESGLTKKEIQTLLTKQTELHQLEKHLTSLQQNQGQVTQIVQKESRGFPEPSKK
ncbi:MAG: hypothetical protein MRECE_32c010 [Mycoplasmataceae bacterium CE_OT135]|nr:MAG: hypothetical protein MRECE_32c010 [Mycoplasmataceae bacterium CE_OT135]